MMSVGSLPVQMRGSLNNRAGLLRNHLRAAIQNLILVPSTWLPMRLRLPPLPKRRPLEAGFNLPLPRFLGSGKRANRLIRIADPSLMWKIVFTGQGRKTSSQIISCFNHMAPPRLNSSCVQHPSSPGFYHFFRCQLPTAANQGFCCRQCNSVSSVLHEAFAVKISCNSIIFTVFPAFLEASQKESPIASPDKEFHYACRI